MLCTPLRSLHFSSLCQPNCACARLLTYTLAEFVTPLHDHVVVRRDVLKSNQDVLYIRSRQYTTNTNIFHARAPKKRRQKNEEARTIRTHACWIVAAWLLSGEAAAAHDDRTNKHVFHEIRHCRHICYFKMYKVQKHIGMPGTQRLCLMVSWLICIMHFHRTQKKPES